MIYCGGKRDCYGFYNPELKKNILDVMKEHIHEHKCAQSSIKINNGTLVHSYISQIHYCFLPKPVFIQVLEEVCSPS